MQKFLTFLKIIFYSGRLLLLVPSAAVILAAITFLFFPGTWTPISLLSYTASSGSGPAGKTPPDADTLAGKIVAELPRPEKSLTRLMVLPLTGDREEMMEKSLRKAVRAAEKNGWYHLVEENTGTSFVKITQDLGRWISSGGKQGEKQKSIQEACALARTASADQVLFGEVTSFSPAGKNRHKIDTRIYLLDVASETTWEREFRHDPEAASSGSGGFSSENAGELPPSGWKYVVAVLFTILWAPVMIPVMQKIVRHENNYHNLFGLLCLTAVAVAPMLVLLWPYLANVYTLIGFILYAAAAFVWTGMIMNRVAGD